MDFFSEFFFNLLLLVVILIVIGLIYKVVRTSIDHYNDFKRDQNLIQGNFAHIKVALKKRLDMIQQLFGVIQDYTNFEKETQTKITKLRGAISRADSKQMNIIDNLSSDLSGKLFAVAENYPDLKAEQTVQNLLVAITSVETEIAERRYNYNELIIKYNTACDVFPSFIFAWIFRFKRLNYLDFTGEVEKAPKMSYYESVSKKKNA